MHTHTHFPRVLSWIMALAMVFSLAVFPAAADEGTYSAELSISFEGVEMSGKLALDTNQLLLAAIAGMTSEGQSVLDAAVYASPQALAVDSILLGGALGVSVPELADNLPGSIFAPDSGSAYALDQQTYDQLMKLFSGGFSQAMPGAAQNSAELQQAAAVLAEALAEPMTQAAANLQMQTQAVTENIHGVSVDATRMTITVDGNAIMGFLEAVITAARGNAQVQDALATILDATNIPATQGVTGEQVVQALLSLDAQALEQAKQELIQEQVALVAAVSVSTETQNPVKLALSIQQSGSSVDIIVLIGEALDFFCLEVDEDGQMIGAFQLETQITESTSTVKFSVLDEGAERASVTLDVNKDAKTFDVRLFSEGSTVTVSGFYTLEEDAITFTVNKVDGEEFGGSISLILRSSDTISMPAFSEITAMSEEEFTALVQQVSQTLEAFSQMLS